MDTPRPASGHPRLLGIAAALLLLPLAASVGGNPARADEKPIVVVRDMDFGSLDPARGYCDTCQIYFNATYDTLLGLSQKATFYPKIATSWEVNADSTRYTFHLDPRAVFSDGTPIEAKDVKWSFERLHNLKGNPSLIMDGLKTVETPDPHTAVVVLDEPNSEFLADVTATFAGIINSTEAAKHGALSTPEAASKDTAEGAFQAQSMGGGPFILTSFKPNDSVVLERNPHYWRTPAGAAKVIMRQVKDAVSQLQLLQTGEADVSTQIDPDTAATIHGGPLVVESSPSYNFVYVEFLPGGPGPSAGKLSKDVRTALGLAIDYKGTADVTVAGKARYLAAPVPLGFPGIDGIPPPHQDVELAKKMLAKAGLADGFGIDMSYPTQNVYGVDFATFAQKVQQDLAKVNVKVNLVPQTFSVWVEMAGAGKIGGTFGYWAPDYFGTSDYIKFFGLVPDTFVAKASGLANLPEGLNAKEGELFKQALAAQGEQAAALFHDASVEMVNDKISIPVFSPDMVIVHTPDVKGVNYNVIANLILPDLHR
jgi:peptide/nickel transport system substrate-binding protein